MPMDLLPSHPNRKINSGEMLARPSGQVEQTQNPDELLQEQHPFLYKIGKFIADRPGLSKGIQVARDVFKAPGEFSAGAAESLINPIISAGNLPLEALFGKRVPHVNFEETLPEESRGSIPKLLGSLAGSIAPYQAASGIIANTPRLPGYLNVLGNVLKGAGLGYTLGESEEGGGRGLSAAVGGGLGSVSGLSRKAISNRIMSDMKKVKSSYKKGYGDLFKEAESRGIKELDIPKKIQTGKIISNSSPRYHRSLLAFQTKPTLENAHKAQSDLGKLVRHMEKLDKNVPLTSDQHAALKSALDAQARIRGSMFKEFSKKNNLDLAKTYGDLTKGYASDVIPYTRNKSIREFSENKLSEKDLLRRLGKGHEFMSQLGSKYPEIGMRSSLDSLLGVSGKAAKYGPLAGGAYLLHQKLSGGQ